MRKEGFSEDWTVDSAGTWAEAGLTVVPSAKWILDQLGLDLETHRARRISRELLARHDLTLVMENNHLEALRVEFPEFKNRIHLLANAATGMAYDVPDPGVAGDTFLDIARELNELIDSGFEKICHLARQMQVKK